MKSLTRKSFAFSTITLALALATPTMTSLPIAAMAAGPKPSIVIVHGAFAGGSDWTKAIRLTQARA